MVNCEDSSSMYTVELGGTNHEYKDVCKYEELVREYQQVDRYGNLRGKDKKSYFESEKYD